MASQNDRVFEQLAKRYVEEAGRRLNLEREQIEAGNPPASLSLERKVREKVGPLRRKQAGRRRIVAAVAALAACLLLLVLAPGIVDMNRGDSAGAPAEGAAGAADGAAAPGDDAPPDAAGAAEESPAAEAGAGMIALELTLPAYFSVRDVERDDGKTIYYLDNARLDDVVLVVEQLAEPLDHSGMTARTVNGHPAWSRSEAEYHLLTFEQDDIVYVLTCRYELDTLLELAEYLL